MRLHIIIAIAAFLPFVGCTCADEVTPWEFEEHFDASEPIEEPDMADVEDLADLPEPPTEWTPEEIEPDVPIEHALNERTALAVDDEGTIWLGYHTCTDRSCDEVYLTLAHKRRGRDWVYERVKRQRGTFGVDVAQPGRPVLAFLDPTDNTFKVAQRTGPDEFEFRNLGVRRSGRSDGLDITRDGERIFVTFANERGDPVALFILAQGNWRSLASLDIGYASAAYERGLGADGSGNLFLVHQRGRNDVFGVARYSLRDSAWRERRYFDDSPEPRPSSLVVRENGEICIASHVSGSPARPYGYLNVTCGDLTDLERDRWDFPDRAASTYASMLEGSDESLYVAYNDGSHDLRLARKRPDEEEWGFETVVTEGETYGVSTVIDSQDLLVISYYLCTNLNCRLEVLSKTQR